MSIFYVYVDWTCESVPRPFYVGRGNAKRIRRLGRNKHHVNVMNKHGINRQIIVETTDINETIQLEIERIAELHTFVGDPEYNGIGCNYSIGGESGNNGFKYSSELIEKFRQIHRETWKDPEKRQRRIESRNRPETNEKLAPQARASQLKNWSDPEYRTNQIESIRIAQNEPETQNKRRTSNSLATKNQWKNNRETILASLQTDEYREKQRLSHLGKKQQCSMCQQVGHKKGTCKFVY